jgi:hypothetical protein
VESFSLRPWRPFFANFAVTSFSYFQRSKTRAFNRKDRKGNAKIAKKRVFWTCSTGVSSLQVRTFSYQALPTHRNTPPASRVPEIVTSYWNQVSRSGGLSLRPWRPFFANFAVTSFSYLRSKTRAFNRKDRKGNAKIAKKGVFWTCGMGISSLQVRTFSSGFAHITASRLLP